MKVEVAFADENTELEIPSSALHNIETERAILGAIIWLLQRSEARLWRRAAGAAG